MYERITQKRNFFGMKDVSLSLVRNQQFCSSCSFIHQH